MRRYFRFKTTFLLLAAIYLFGHIETVSAQEMIRERYSRAQGLPSDFVFDLHQDQDGFIWIATDAGIARYDGSQFQSFQHIGGRPNPLVYTIAEDSSGTIWTGTFEAGISRAADGAFIQPSGLSELHDVSVSGMQFDSFGRLFYRLSGALFVHENDQSDLVVSFPDLEPRSGVVSISENLKATSSGDSLFVVSSTSREILVRSYSLPKPTTAESDSLTGTINGLAVLPDGRLLVSSTNPGNRIWIFDEKNPENPWAVFTDVGAQVLSLGAHPDGRIFIGTKSSLTIIDSLSSSVGQSSIPVDFWIQDILIDYEGTVWLALFGDGIYRYGGSHIKSGGVIHPDLTQSLNWLYVDRVGKAWTGTSEYLYSIAGDRVDRYKGRHLLGGIEQRPDGRYYVVSESAVFGPEAYEDVGARSSFVASIPNWPSGMHAVGKDSLWVSSYGGGATLIVSGTIRKTYSKQDGLASNMIDRLIPTQSGLWFLSRGEGMSRITTDSVWTQTTADDLPSNVTYTLFEDADGTLWTGTDKGIAQRNGGRWRTYTSNGLLMGERTHVIFRKSNAPDGPLYALSGRHLYLFDESDNDFHRLGSFIVLVNEDASINQAVYHGLSSVLYLATTKGFESIKIDNPVGRPTPPKTAITALRFGDVILEPGDDTIRVPYTENNIFIDFAVLSFTNENATTVEYRLGSSAEWINAPSVRTVSLLDVADGRHEFQLRAYSADGIPSNTSMSVMFEVVPPFWRTTWFRLVAILILLIATATGIRYLLARRLDERVRELSIIEHVQFERTRISRDIHDNVGAQVSNLIAGIELTKMNVLHRGTETIGEQLDVLEDDARLTMAQLRETIWALKQNEISLGDFSQQLTRFMLRQTAYGGPTPSPIKIVGDEQFVLSPERALELYRIAQEAISNAVRHSGGSTLSVMLESAGESVVMLIEDDGDFTVQKKDEFGGNGIPNMRRRAQNLNGLFSIETTDGTSIRIEIPRRPA